MTLDELSAQAGAAKLSEELSEVSAAVLKFSLRSRGADTPLVQRKAQLRDELADLFGFLLMFAESRGIDLGAALMAKWGRCQIAEIEA